MGTLKTLTLTAGTLQAIRERVGKRGVSAYLEKAAQRQIEQDNLDELIADFDKVHGHRGDCVSDVLVLDSEGLAKAVQRDRELHKWLMAARDGDLSVITSAAVLVEVIHPKINEVALRRTPCRIRVEPVTQGLAQAAATLLRRRSALARSASAPRTTRPRAPVPTSATRVPPRCCCRC